MRSSTLQSWRRRYHRRCEIITRYNKDVAVRKGYEGKGVGSAVVGKAIQRARELGCYKVILDRKEELVPFYTGLGMRRHEVGMRIDLK